MPRRKKFINPLGSDDDSSIASDDDGISGASDDEWLPTSERKKRPGKRRHTLPPLLLTTQPSTPTPIPRLSSSRRRTCSASGFKDGNGSPVKRRRTMNLMAGEELGEEVMEDVAGEEVGEDDDGKTKSSEDSSPSKQQRFRTSGGQLLATFPRAVPIAPHTRWRVRRSSGVSMQEKISEDKEEERMEDKTTGSDQAIVEEPCNEGVPQKTPIKKKKLRTKSFETPRNGKEGNKMKESIKQEEIEEPLQLSPPPSPEPDSPVPEFSDALESLPEPETKCALPTPSPPQSATQSVPRFRQPQEQPPLPPPPPRPQFVFRPATALPNVEPIKVPTIFATPKAAPTVQSTPLTAPSTISTPQIPTNTSTPSIKSPTFPSAEDKLLFAPIPGNPLHIGSAALEAAVCRINSTPTRYPGPRPAAPESIENPCSQCKVAGVDYMYAPCAHVACRWCWYVQWERAQVVQRVTTKYAPVKCHACDNTIEELAIVANGTTWRVVREVQRPSFIKAVAGRRRYRFDPYGSPNDGGQRRERPKL